MQPDCVIIGGGIMGCMVGMRLAQAGVATTILERAVVGAEASSAAAGILSPQAEEEHLGSSLALALASRDLYPRLAAELGELTGVDIGYRQCGSLLVALDDSRAAQLRGLVARHAAAGLPAETLSGAALAELEPALAAARLAVRFGADAQVEPRALMRALAIAARRAGCQVVTGKVIRRVVIEHGGVVGLEADDGVMPCARVVVAAGSWSGLVGGLEGVGVAPTTVRPARGQLCELDLRVPLFEHVVFGPRGYLVPRPDGRVVAGSTLEFVGYDKGVTAGGVAAVLDAALELVPALASAPVSGMWAGLRPHSQRLLIGPTAVRGLALATGHFRNGILLGPITAELVVDHLLGRPARFPLPA